MTLLTDCHLEVVGEENSLKAFLRQSFRFFDFSNLSSDSRNLESVTLKSLSNRKSAFVNIFWFGSGNESTK